MNVFRTETPPLFRWRNDALFDAPWVAPLVATSGPGAMKGGAINGRSVYFRAQDVGFEALGSSAARGASAKPGSAALRPETRYESDRLQAEIHRNFGPGVVLAPNTEQVQWIPLKHHNAGFLIRTALKARSWRSLPLPINVSMLPSALTLSALGIPSRPQRASHGQDGVFFGHALSHVNRNPWAQPEYQRIVLAEALLALGETEVGRQAILSLGGASKPTRFQVFNEDIDPSLTIYRNSGVAGRADPKKRHIRINERVLRSMAQDFVFGSERDPLMKLDRLTILLHEIKHIQMKDADHPAIAVIERYFMRSQGYPGDSAALRKRAHNAYKAALGRDQYSRAVLYLQLNALVDQINHAPETYDQAILSHLRDQASLGVNIERYVNWLLPELDKRLTPQAH